MGRLTLILLNSLALTLTLPMCGWETTSMPVDTDTESESDTDSDSGTDSQTNTEADTDSDTVTDSETDTGTSPDFISVWDSSWGPGSTWEDQIELPLVSNGQYDFTVNWGDGTEDTIADWEDPAKMHTYAKAGEYELTISGLINDWAFGWEGDRGKILLVKNWGSFGFGQTAGHFDGCNNLEITATDTPNLEGTTSLNRAFRDCDEIREIPSLPQWNTSSVTDMSHMFDSSRMINQDLSGLDTSSVTNMSYMFDGARVFTGDISNWDTSKVTNMSYMFWNARHFDTDISAWDTSKVTNMVGMFGGSITNQTFFNQDISDWDVSNVTNMQEMFRATYYFNQDISNWDTSKVTNMSGMFGDTEAFNQDLSGWNISGVTNMEGMFSNITLSTPNYDAILIGWENQPVQNNVTFHGGYSVYSPGPAAEARARLIDEHGWIITDGGEI